MEPEYGILENALIHCLFLWWRDALAKGRAALAPTICAVVAVVVFVVGLLHVGTTTDLVHDALILSFASIGIAIVAIVAGPAFDWFYHAPGARIAKHHEKLVS